MTQAVIAISLGIIASLLPLWAEWAYFLSFPALALMTLTGLGDNIGPGNVHDETFWLFVLALNTAIYTAIFLGVFNWWGKLRNARDENPD